jgi:4'-phosphopantetheinyl transferase
VAPSRRRLALGQVAVHRVALAVDEAERERCQAVLSADEHARAGRFRIAADRDRFVVARACLRYVLSSYGAGRPERIRFHYGWKGKPVLTADRDLHFNLSHSKDLAIVALARGAEVGIDVERIRDVPSARAIARRFFSPAESAVLTRLPSSDFKEAFWRCWTRKEAYVKACGDGLSLPLDSFDVSLEIRGWSLLVATRPDAGEAHRWQLLDVNVGPGYVAALAVGGRVKRLRCVRFPWPARDGAARAGQGEIRPGTPRAAVRRPPRAGARNS